MNIENMKKLSAHLRNVDDGPVSGAGFNMSHWIDTTDDPNVRDVKGYECGTVACIAGHAQILAESWTDNIGAWASITAAKWLGLDSSSGVAIELFTPTRESAWEITAKQAADVLEAMIENPPETKAQMMDIWDQVLDG